MDKLTDKNGPEVNEDEKGNIGNLVERKQIRIHVIRYALRESVQWMKRVARKGRRHDPLMMALMKGFVDSRVVQAPVDQIDEAVGEQDEEGELQVIVQGKRGVGAAVV